MLYVCVLNFLILLSIFIDCLDRNDGVVRDAGEHGWDSVWVLGMMKYSLRDRLVRSMVLNISFVTGASLIAVLASQYISATHALSEVQQHITKSLQDKGESLSYNQALSLRGLAADNAFTDIKNIIGSTVERDEDIIYGLFLSEDSIPWVYESPSNISSENVGSAVSELQIDTESLSQTKNVKREITVFDQNIIEFSAPVRDEDYYLGSLFYGISTASMERVIAQAKQEQLTSILRMVGFILLATMIFTLIAIARSQRGATKITKPIKTLTEAAILLSKGDRNVTVDVKSGDELEVLADTFNQMVADLKDSYEKLEEKVEERTVELASRTQEMAIVLENVSQGLVKLSPDGLMSAERSAVLDTWLGPPPPSMHIVEHLARYDEGTAEMFSIGLDIIQDGIFPPEISLSQFPQRTHLGGRDLEFSYTPIYAGGQTVLSGILLTITDITTELARQRAEAQQREVMEVFRRISKDPRGFDAFWEEASKIVAVVTTESTSSVEPILLARMVHTLKGNASIMGLDSVAYVCSNIEDDLINEGLIPEEQGRRLLERWRELGKAVKEFTGEKDLSLLVEPNELDRLINRIDHGIDQEHIVRILRSWHLEPVRLPLRRLADRSQGLAERLGKAPIEVVVEDNDIRLPVEKWQSFFSELIHVIRNALDHGLESIQEREAAGKRPNGRLRLEALDTDEAFMVAIEDDGRGIDWEAVARASAKLNVAAESEEDLKENLFRDGLSTRGIVSDLSGRGVGMSAVKAACEALGGRIELTSQAKVGTRFEFKFPPNPREFRNLWSL